jgi:MYXO-CTERM domain-containing protein
MRARLAAASLAVVLSSAAPAVADVPPPDGYVEKCTAAQQQRPGTECYGCGSYHGSVEKCPNLLGANGLTKACQSYGASVWTEVWCRPAGGPALPPDVATEVHAPTPEQVAAAAATPPGRSGCGSCATAGAFSPSSIDVTALAALAVILGLRRRRQR